MDAIELGHLVAELGGVRGAARALGCGAATISRYLDGSRAIPAPFAERVRQEEARHV